MGGRERICQNLMKLEFHSLGTLGDRGNRNAVVPAV